MTDIIKRPFYSVIKRPFIWTVERPNGKRWKRNFHSVDAAWNSLSGNTWYLKSNPFGSRMKWEAMGYKVVPVAWVSYPKV